MSIYYLAVDIGASNGRHILATLREGKIWLEEIHRFENSMKQRNGVLCWDVEALFQEILTGMKKCREIGKVPYSMGVDTWGVDYVLLDKKGDIIGDAVGYRDDRTKGMDEKVYEYISPEDLYARTGIQKQIFNTIYQLMAVKEKSPEKLEQADTLLQLPDYFHYLLTGEKVSEYTNATTTQLVSPQTKQWDKELIERLGYPTGIFADIVKPGTLLGELSEETAEKVGFTCKVVVPATHDTASAVAAVPSNEENTLYISSGTWSLMGVELREANCSEESNRKNLTNEGGYDYRFRYLKNIMGLWMIQSVRKEIGQSYRFQEICTMAEKEKIKSLVDCNDERFLAPDSMVLAIQDYCKQTEQEEPQTLAEIARVIYRSLAECYAGTITKIEEMTGITYTKLHIVGGGANVSYLNQLTADAIGREVVAGPTEATAIGNLAIQMLSAGEIGNLKEARQIIAASFPLKQYEPEKGESHDNK